MDKKSCRKKNIRGRVDLNRDRCKGCGYCILSCTQKLLVIDTEFNAGGYFPVRFIGGDCTGCALCAVMCPEIAINVWRESGAGKK
ncbi:MAG TPA: 4Fe-4S dicluster domain-containing protein [Dissulfurispiraceae bacterium]|nr:4Fe-4S dicluster domain-containing protein [Dissulfurispiraceae bacterium]